MFTQPAGVTTRAQAAQGGDPAAGNEPATMLPENAATTTNSGSSEDEDVEIARLRRQLERAELRRANRRERRGTSPTASTSNPPAVSRPPTAAAPDRFAGERTRFPFFVSQLNTLMVLHGDGFPSDRHKVAYVSTLLTGPAEAWFLAVSTRRPELLEEYGLFLRELHAMFGDSNLPETAAGALASISQGSRSVDTYSLEFLQHMAHVPWPEEMLLPLFRKGLTREMQLTLIGLPAPATLHELMQTATKIDRERRRLGETSQPAKPTASPARQGRRPGQSQLDPAERTHRLRNNLCLKCGQLGHFARDCGAQGQSGKGEGRS